MSDCLLDLLRHGETEGTTCFRGSQDDPLSARGWEQLTRATADDALRWTNVICSPARRCAEFAQQFAATQSLPITVTDDFRERHFGAWEGLTAAQIPLDALRQFWDDPAGFDPPDAEPFAIFRERVIHAWTNLLHSTAPHTLLVTHGGVIRVLLTEVLRMPDAASLLIEVPHACLTRLRLPEPPGYPSLMIHRGEFT